jgi:hypothetical protein
VRVWLNDLLDDLAEGDGPTIVIVLCVLFILSALLALGIAGGEDTTCEEYGTVMVTVGKLDKRCVPWELAPDLQDFPKP